MQMQRSRSWVIGKIGGQRKRVIQQGRPAGALYMHYILQNKSSRGVTGITEDAACASALLDQSKDVYEQCKIL
jgi:hypothetical protein